MWIGIGCICITVRVTEYIFWLNNFNNKINPEIVIEQKKQNNFIYVLEKFKNFIGNRLHTPNAIKKVKTVNVKRLNSTKTFNTVCKCAFKEFSINSLHTC
jgi:hypothetical protein